MKISKEVAHSIAARFNDISVWLGIVLISFLSDRSRNGLAEPIRHLQRFILQEEKEALPEKMHSMLHGLNNVLAAMRASTNGGRQAVDWSRIADTVTAIEKESEDLLIRWRPT